MEILIGTWGFASPFIYVFLIQQYREENECGVLVPKRSKTITMQDLKKEKIIL
jgi:hypothetical protein